MYEFYWHSENIEKEKKIDFGIIYYEVGDVFANGIFQCKYNSNS